MTNTELVARARELADKKPDYADFAESRSLLPALATALSESVEREERLVAALRTALNVIDTTHAQAFGRDVLVPPHHGDPKKKGEANGGYCWACEFTLQARALLAETENT